MDKNPFGEKLRKIRVSKNETLRNLADRAKLSYSFISSIESGRYRPSKETVIALTKALDYEHVNEMLFLSGYAPTQDINTQENQNLDFEITYELSLLNEADKKYILDLIRRINK
jgi:transcriptional regulator with XRE-family HTH domain